MMYTILNVYFRRIFLCLEYRATTDYNLILTEERKYLTKIVL